MYEVSERVSLFWSRLVTEALSGHLVESLTSLLFVVRTTYRSVWRGTTKTSCFLF